MVLVEFEAVLLDILCCVLTILLSFFYLFSCMAYDAMPSTSATATSCNGFLGYVTLVLLFLIANFGQDGGIGLQDGQRNRQAHWLQDGMIAQQSTVCDVSQR